MEFLSHQEKQTILGSMQNNCKCPKQSHYKFRGKFFNFVSADIKSYLMVLTTEGVSLETFAFTFLFAGINLQLHTVKMQQEIGIQFFNVAIIMYLQHQ